MKNNFTIRLKKSGSFKIRGSRNSIRIAPLLLSILALFFVFVFGGCNYRFNDVAIPTDVKTIRINYIENRARLVNPQLSPRLSDRLRQKIVSQTKLVQTNNENPDWDVSGEVTEYAISTSGISNQQASSNRITVSVHIEVYKRKKDATDKYDVSRNFEFSANLSLQQAESLLGEEMIKTITDDIFNRIFSEW